MTAIQKIRVEIKRRMREVYNTDNSYDDTARSVCSGILGYIDSLVSHLILHGWQFESWEIDVDLEKEIEDYLDHAELETTCNGISAAEAYFNDLKRTARHFYDLGCCHAAAMYDEIEHERQRKAEATEGLEEAADKSSREYRQYRLQYGYDDVIGLDEVENANYDGFLCGAKWDAERRMTVEDIKTIIHLYGIVCEENKCGTLGEVYDEVLRRFKKAKEK